MSLQPPDLLALETFRNGSGGRPTVEARAPGRVELLGNHTDYNGGLVLAAAIDRVTVVVGRPRADRMALLRSANDPKPEAFPIDAIERGEEGRWGRYARGVVWALQERFGPLASGFEAALAGNVPLGAGLSSSASLQASLALFLLGAGLVGQGTGGVLDDAARMDLAQTLRRSENAFVGVQSGLLDQFSALFGRADHALLLDCRSLDYGRLPLGTPAPAIVVCDSKTSRRLADGMYNQRRSESDRVLAWFQAEKGPDVVKSLRDASLGDLEAAWEQLDPVGRRRARHVLNENERVRQGADALRRGELAVLGRLMSASHASSRIDFENSSRALDALIEAAEESPGFLGGKLSGAGWAGCTVNLVRADLADAFAGAVRAGYAGRTGTEPAVHICRGADGVCAAPFPA
jgi:galactokinase